MKRQLLNYTCFILYQKLSPTQVCLCGFNQLHCLFSPIVPTGSPSRGGDVAVYVFDINQPSLPTLFYSVLVSISVFMALSTAFHSINPPDNSPLSHSVLPVLILVLLVIITRYLFMKVSLSPDNPW